MMDFKMQSTMLTRNRKTWRWFHALQEKASEKQEFRRPAQSASLEIFVVPHHLLLCAFSTSMNIIRHPEQIAHTEAISHNKWSQLIPSSFCVY
jgi:hypothetical protein